MTPCVDIQTVLPIDIKNLAFRLVAQDVVGFIDLDKFIFRLFLPIGWNFIRMVLQGEFAIGRFDLFRRSILGDAQNGIIIVGIYWFAS